jgi:hypothetical protein
LKSKYVVLLFAASLALAGCSSGSEASSEDSREQGAIELVFNNKTVVEPKKETLGEGWTVKKEDKLGESEVIIYEDTSGVDLVVMKREGEHYLLSGIHTEENLETQPLDGEFIGIDLIGGVGSEQTEWNILGLNKEGNLVVFSMIGRPQITDLDADGEKELIASFEGAHLHFPDVEIARVKNGSLESARVIGSSDNADDPQYARLLSDGNLIQIGKVREERSGRQYEYDGGRLIPIEN